MADVLEQVRIYRCRIRRRRWLGLAVAWATCALGWMAFGPLTAERSAATAGLIVSLVWLAGSLPAALRRRWSPPASRCSTASQS